MTYRRVFLPFRWTPLPSMPSAASKSSSMFLELIGVKINCWSFFRTWSFYKSQGPNISVHSTLILPFVIVALDQWEASTPKHIIPWLNREHLNTPIRSWNSKRPLVSWTCFKKKRQRQNILKAIKYVNTLDTGDLWQLVTDVVVNFEVKGFLSFSRPRCISF